MIWFLRLFPEYRDLDALIETLSARVEDAEGRADHAAEAYGILKQEVDTLKAEANDLRTEAASLSLDIRNLHEANTEFINEKLRLEDRLSTALDDKQRLWDSMNESLRGERYAYQTMVNHAVQGKGFGVPYPEAHTLPPEAVRKPQEPGPIGRTARMLPSEMAERANRQFVHTYVENLAAAEAAKPH